MKERSKKELVSNRVSIALNECDELMYPNAIEYLKNNGSKKKLILSVLEVLITSYGEAIEGTIDQQMFIKWVEKEFKASIPKKPKSKRYVKDASLNNLKKSQKRKGLKKPDKTNNISNHSSNENDKISYVETKVETRNDNFFREDIVEKSTPSKVETNSTPSNFWGNGNVVESSENSEATENVFSLMGFDLGNI